MLLNGEQVTVWKEGTEMKHFCLRSINSLILFGIRKNCLLSGRGLYCTNLKKGTKTDRSNCCRISVPST
jgi:hypothetical protein